MKKQAVFLFFSPILNLLKSANKHTVKETFLRHEKYVPQINQKIHPIKVIVKSLHWGCSCPLYWLKKYNRLIIDWYKGNWSTIQNSSKSWGKNFFLQESIAVNETASSPFAFLPLLNRNVIYPALKPKSKQKRKKKKPPNFDSQCDREPVEVKKV